MSLREDMEKATKEIADEKNAEEEEIRIFIKDRFHKMIQHCENTEISVKMAAIEVLEGMENGLRDVDHKIKESFRKIASETFKIPHESDEKNNTKQ